MAPEAPPRRFAPTPVETTSKSSKQITPSQPAPRKFAIEPIESTSKSSKNQETKDTLAKAPRKFSVEPVETSSKHGGLKDEPTSRPKSRFAPQPIETSTKSSRSSASTPLDDEATSPKSTKSSINSDKPPRRKFAPELIDTAKRTRKATDDGPAHLPTDKTDIIPAHTSGSQRPSKAAGNDTMPFPKLQPHHLPLPHELRRDRSPRGRSDSRSSMRSHSFRLPDLETIESSESEPSNPPSLSTSPSSSPESPLTSSDAFSAYNHATRRRESGDETFARYLLQLEARRAEQKMQEQALSAFPNSDWHEPVQHYVDESDSDEMEIDDRPATWDGHDEDAAGELHEMQQQHEQLEQERLAAKTTAKRESTYQSPWWNPAALGYGANTGMDPELRPMRDQARPPMLGSDIEFPRSASPEPARFDVTQGSEVLRSQMCYLTEQSDASGVNQASPDGLWGKSEIKTPKTTRSQGLWGGFCLDAGDGTAPKIGGLAPPSGPTGLLTPALEQSNPFNETLFTVPINVQSPPTPPLANEGPATIDSVLNSEREVDELMEHEYNDTFITQVYNYLSLGYPSLARDFDEELSKITQVPMAELRHDDVVAKSMPKGYIRLGDDFEGRGDGVDQGLQEGGCARWRALKSYVREWAKQEKGMVKEDALAGAWGTGARRGSWAW